MHKCRRLLLGRRMKLANSNELLTLLILGTLLDSVTKAQGTDVSLRAHEGVEHRTCLIHAWVV